VTAAAGGHAASGAAGDSILVLLGPPGAGKGTQGERLSAELHIPKIATGDVLRSAVREGTALGREAKSYMDRGALVPDDVILGIMRETLAAPGAAHGAILDGVVRTVPQAEGLERLLTTLGRRVTGVILFDVNEDELVRRISGRTVCALCQTPYMGLEPGTTCPKCGGTLVRRKDDEPDAVRNRLRVYHTDTAPVIKWYESHHVPMHRIDAVGTLDEVAARVRRSLGR
jgi:adenylate kinase